MEFQVCPQPITTKPTQSRQVTDEQGISWTALLACLERLHSKNSSPDNEWYHGWNAAIQCLINDINARKSLPVTAPQGDAARKLTLPELNHLSALLDAERENGSYAGPREQYYARTERLIKWCSDQIGGS